MTLCGASGRLDREFSLPHQAVLHGEEGGCRPRGHAHLAVPALDVVVSRLDRDSQRACDLFGLQPTGEESDDLCLALRQPSWSLDSRRSLAGRLKHRLDSDSIQPSNVDLVG